MKTRISVLTLLMMMSLFLFCQNDESKIYKHTIPASGEQTLSPYFFIKSDKPSEDKFPLTATYVDVKIAGVIADVSVYQTYINESSKVLEAIYIFPGSDEAAVYGMTMKIGERTLIAKIKEKTEAKKDYEKAKKEGKTVTLLEQNRPNVFQMNVANILPGDTIEVELKYTELINFTSGIYKFVYPQIVLPRYSESDEEWNEQLTSQFTASTDESFVDLNIDVDFDINISINAGIPVDEISSTFHNINIDNEGFESNISLQDIHKKLSKNDFILNYSLMGKEVQSGLIVYETEEENYFALIVQPPNKVETKDIPTREYIFIVDVSDSMSGYPIETTKKMITKLFLNLNKDDIFNVMAFSGGNRVLFDKSEKATEENRQLAIDFFANSYGSGGTKILPALKEALTMKTNDNYSRTFVVLTDGAVTCETAAFELVRDNLNNANLFAVGIGAWPNNYIINGLAYSGMGNPFFVANQQEAELFGDTLINIISNPVLTNINIDYENVDVYDVEPKSIPDVFADRPILVYGKYEKNKKGYIEIEGITGNGKFNQKYYFDDAKSENNSALEYLWARNRIKYLDDYEIYYKEFTDDEKKQEVTQLGLKYGLLTEYTSFIAVDDVVRVEQTSIDTENYEDMGNIDDDETEEEILEITRQNPTPSPPPSNLTYNILEIVDDDADYSDELQINFEFDENEKISFVEMDINEEEEEVVDEIFLCVEQMPEFPGGEVSIKNYIAENLQYPEEARENSIQGTVYVRFVVTTTGEIDQVQIVRSVDTLLDAEALRIVKSLPKWTPGKQRGKYVAVWYTIPIKFVLQ